MTYNRLIHKLLPKLSFWPSNAMLLAAQMIAPGGPEHSSARGISYVCSGRMKFMPVGGVTEGVCRCVFCDGEIGKTER